VHVKSAWFRTLRFAPLTDVAPAFAAEIPVRLDVTPEFFPEPTIRGHQALC
jgi:hypothetical protein